MTNDFINLNHLVVLESPLYTKTKKSCINIQNMIYAITLNIFLRF